MRLSRLKPLSHSLHQTLLLDAALGTLPSALVFACVRMATRHEEDLETRVSIALQQFADVLFGLLLRWLDNSLPAPVDRGL